MADTNFDSVVATTFTGTFVGPITGAVTATTGSFSGAVSLAAGLVGTPSLTFTGDTDTGLYRVAANSLGVAAGGALVGTFTSTGLQGAVGATTPAAGAFTTVTASTSIDGALGVNTPAPATVTQLSATAYIQGSVGNALSAAGTTRADALALTKAINNITTAGASTGAVLPAASTVGIGGSVIIFNAGANAIKVYAAGSDTIDTVAGATGVTLTNTKRCIYIVVAANTYVSAQLGVISA